MTTISRFTQKFADAILSTLNCHDRVIFKGYLPYFRDDDLHRLSDWAYSDPKQRELVRKLDRDYIAKWNELYDLSKKADDLDLVLTQTKPRP